MLLKIVHETDLRYSDLISESIMELRMVPRQEQDQQGQREQCKPAQIPGNGGAHCHLRRRNAEHSLEPFD